MNRGVNEGDIASRHGGPHEVQAPDSPSSWWSARFRRWILDGISTVQLQVHSLPAIYCGLLFPPVRFWGWTENKREEAMDREELTQRAQQGLPLYGESFQPEWVQGAAHRNSAFSQLKFGECHILLSYAHIDGIITAVFPM